jgi:hypothetical protein
MVKKSHQVPEGQENQGGFVMGYYEAAIGTFTPAVDEKAKDAPPAEARLTREEEAELQAE